MKPVIRTDGLTKHYVHVAAGIPAAHAAIGALAMVLIGLLYGWLALAVGAATGRRGLAIAVSGTLAVAAYVLHVVRWWKGSSRTSHCRRSPGPSRQGR